MPHAAIVVEDSAMRPDGEEVRRYRTIELADPKVVRAYAQDLKSLLEGSGINVILKS
jgi:hypothetical protein